MLFKAPPLVPVMRHACFSQVRLCMCAFKAPWRKVTRLAAWNTDVSSLDGRMCHGRSGVCQFTGKHHVVLSGRDARTGKTWTSLAGAYPAAFAAAAVAALAQASDQYDMLAAPIIS